MVLSDILVVIFKDNAPKTTRSTNSASWNHEGTSFGGCHLPSILRNTLAHLKSLSAQMRSNFKYIFSLGYCIVPSTGTQDLPARILTIFHLSIWLLLPNPNLTICFVILSVLLWYLTILRSCGSSMVKVTGSYAR